MSSGNCHVTEIPLVIPHVLKSECFLKGAFMIERRVNERTGVNLRAVFRKDDSYVISAMVTNISMGGLFMKTPFYLKCGTNVAVDIDAENIGQVIGVYGLVVRNTETGTAVEFAQVNPNLDRLIKTERFMAEKIRL
jgi:Tfp pilus assembly protein PilZ